MYDGADGITKNKKDTLKAVVGALVVLLILDLSPLGGNTIMYIHWFVCGGGLPFQSGRRVFDDKPYYEKAPVFTVMRGYPKYFCTPEQAERAGYSSDPHSYTYPHLNTDSERREAYSNTNRILNEK